MKCVFRSSEMWTVGNHCLVLKIEKKLDQSNDKKALSCTCPFFTTILQNAK